MTMATSGETGDSISILSRVFFSNNPVSRSFWAEINKSIMPVSFAEAGFSSSDMCCSTVYEGNRKFRANDIDKYCAALVEKCRKNFSEWLFIVTFE